MIRLWLDWEPLTGEGVADVPKKPHCIVIFTYKQWLSSIDMKTKVVQQVPMIKFYNLTTLQPNNLILLSIDMKTKVVQHVKSE